MIWSYLIWFYHTNIYKQSPSHGQGLDQVGLFDRDQPENLMEKIDGIFHGEIMEIHEASLKNDHPMISCFDLDDSCLIFFLSPTYHLVNKLTVCYWKWPNMTVNSPIKDGDVPYLYYISLPKGNMLWICLGSVLYPSAERGEIPPNGPCLKGKKQW